MVEHGVSWENMESINQVTKNTLSMNQNNQVTQNQVTQNQVTQNTLRTDAQTDGQKIITCALGEHDPGSAQDGRT